MDGLGRAGNFHRTGDHQQRRIGADPEAHLEESASLGLSCGAVDFRALDIHRIRLHSGPDSFAGAVILGLVTVKVSPLGFMKCKVNAVLELISNPVAYLNIFPISPIAIVIFYPSPLCYPLLCPEH